MIVTRFRSYVDNNDSEKSIFRLQLRIEFLIFAEKKRHLSLITTGFMKLLKKSVGSDLPNLGWLRIVKG